jgi:hypothetical protein
MKKIIAALSLLACCTGALADPVVFTSATYTTTAFASAGAVFDGPFTDDFPTTALPLLTSASAASAPDSATATGIADDLFLSATAEASSAVDSASAGAIATFTGVFATGGTFSLSVDFDSQALGLGTAGNQLAFSLTANGTTIFDEIFSDVGTIARDFTLPAGSFATIDLTLTSNADALLNDAFALSSANITLDVPEPATGFLFVAGALGLALRRRQVGRL